MFSLPNLLDLIFWLYPTFFGWYFILVKKNIDRFRRLFLCASKDKRGGDDAIKTVIRISKQKGYRSSSLTTGLLNGYEKIDDTTIRGNGESEGDINSDKTFTGAAAAAGVSLSFEEEEASRVKSAQSVESLLFPSFISSSASSLGGPSSLIVEDGSGKMWD
jgi:hypothetical protein